MSGEGKIRLNLPLWYLFPARGRQRGIEGDFPRLQIPPRPPFLKLILTHNLGCWIQGGKRGDGS